MAIELWRTVSGTSVTSNAHQITIIMYSNFKEFILGRYNRSYANIENVVRLWSFVKLTTPDDWEDITIFDVIDNLYKYEEAWDMLYQGESLRNDPFRYTNGYIAYGKLSMDDDTNSWCISKENREKQVYRIAVLMGNIYYMKKYGKFDSNNEIEDFLINSPDIMLGTNVLKKRLENWKNEYGLTIDDFCEWCELRPDLNMVQITRIVLCDDEYELYYGNGLKYTFPKTRLNSLKFERKH